MSSEKGPRWCTGADIDVYEQPLDEAGEPPHVMGEGRRPIVQWGHTSRMTRPPLTGWMLYYDVGDGDIETHFIVGNLAERETAIKEAVHHLNERAMYSLDRAAQLLHRWQSGEPLPNEEGDEPP